MCRVRGFVLGSEEGLVLLPGLWFIFQKTVEGGRSFSQCFNLVKRSIRCL